MNHHIRTILLASLTAVAVTFPQAQAAEKALINPPPTAKDWADLAKLPDWSGLMTAFSAACASGSVTAAAVSDASRIVQM